MITVIIDDPGADTPLTPEIRALMEEYEQLLKRLAEGNLFASRPPEPTVSITFDFVEPRTARGRPIANPHAPIPERIRRRCRRSY
jgi:hypothetical protein